MAMSFVGPTMFPRIFIFLCKIWVIVALGALVMPLAVWIMIFIQNTQTFAETMGHYMGNDQRVYDQMDNNPDAGYVSNTNIPKHLAGVIFAAAFDVGMWILILISMAADLFWKFDLMKRFLEAFWVTGLYDERKFVEMEFFFIIANAFLKLFIVAATGAQTYTGLVPDMNDSPAIDTPLFCLYAVMILLCSIPLT
ncbi:hypothetical protein IAT40_000687 [Kwoniella sp. CBS 6097]